MIAPNEKSEGFEPGPLSFGRGQKLMVFDLWADHPGVAATFAEQMPEAARARRDSALLALSRDSKHRAIDGFAKQLQKDVERWIAVDAAEMADPATILKTGVFAPVLAGLSLPELSSAQESASDRAAWAGLETMK